MDVHPVRVPGLPGVVGVRLGHHGARHLLCRHWDLHRPLQLLPAHQTG